MMRVVMDLVESSILQLPEAYTDKDRFFQRVYARALPLSIGQDQNVGGIYALTL